MHTNIPTVFSTMFRCEVPAWQDLPCGARAVFEQESTIGGYRCEACGAIVGSISMPKDCDELWRKNNDCS